MNWINNFKFMGVPVSSFTKLQLLKELIFTVKHKKSLVIYGHSLGVFHAVLLYPEVLDYFNKIDIFVSDGHKFHSFGKKLGFPFKYFISIPETTHLLLDIANKYKLKLLLLGATKESNELANRKIKECYREIIVLEGIDGYFTENEEDKIVEEINIQKPDIIFIGMNTPKKQEFIYKHRNKILNSVIILNGGMIDVLAGKIKQTPNYLKKMGFAMFNRLIQEPKLRYKRVLVGFSLEFFYFIPSILFNIGLRRKYDFNIKDTFLYRMRHIK